MTEVLSECLVQHDAFKLEPVLLKAGIPAGVVRNVNEALEHPHTRHRGMVVSVGTYRGTGVPARLSRTPGAVRVAPPRFGQHSRQLLSEAGLTEAEIDRLTQADIVREEPRMRETT